MTTTDEFHLPKYHDKQQEIADSTAKRKVIVTGRRFGKTTMVSIMAVEGLLQGKRVLYAAPKEAQTEAFWGLCKGYLAPLIPRYVYKNETLRQLRVEPRVAGDPAGGNIRAKTAFDADSLRGDYADLLILDEYSYMDPDVWELVGVPMLLDNDGDAVFIFTPARKNHAYKLYLRAQAEGGRWGAWHATTMDNPHLSEDAVAEMASDMTSEAYRQEILAEFLEGEGQVFRNIPANLWRPKEQDIRAHMGHSLVAGLDWGRKNDATVISIGCQDCQKELVLDRFTKVSYPIQRDRIKAHVDRWHPSLLAEANSMGLPNIEQMREDGVAVEEFDTTAQSKGQLVRAMQLALEKETWKWLDNPVANGEMEAYEMRVTRTGNVSYSAPEGLHDDTVMARCIMLHRATHGGALLSFGE